MPAPPKNLEYGAKINLTRPSIADAYTDHKTTIALKHEEPDSYASDEATVSVGAIHQFDVHPFQQPRALTHPCQRIGLRERRPDHRSDAVSAWRRQGAGAGRVSCGECVFARPPDVNRAYRQTDGSLLARLSATEVLWLGAQASGAGEARWLCPDGQPLAPDTYTVPRQSGTYWFHLGGDAAAGGFSTLCGVDLSAASFPDLEVAQTLVARTGAIIIREDISGVTSFHLLGDVSLAAYMWEVLGSIIGIHPGR